MKLLLVFAVVVVADPAALFREDWQNFRINHGKTYKSLKEEKRRFLIFQSNLRTMEQHNARFAKGEVSYSVGINEFTDLTDEELAKTLTPMPSKPVGIPHKKFNGTGIVTFGEINWVTKGVVTSVKHQRTCGCCWAFSAIGAIEGQVAKSGQPLVSLSAQNLVDCARNGNNGCRGGFMPAAFEYVRRNGVLTDAEYPFRERQMPCRRQGGQKISGYVVIDDNEEDLLKALATVGPISVAMSAIGLFRYRSGIFDASSGCTDQLNHGVLLVGAGTENGRDYWLIKNSWGREFGQDGYFKLARNEGACGVWQVNTYPTL